MIGHRTKITPGKSFNADILQGKALKVYWHLLENGTASIREIHKALEFSSPGIAYYQIKKLMAAGIVTKDEETDKYFIHEETKAGVLNLYINVGNLLIPRFSIYLAVFLVGFIICIVSALVWGDQFIGHLGTILLLLFLTFGTATFIYESMRTWKLKPN
ncbi:MAG: helix-turn-helix domain-containing protein [Candidatus Hodarchaeota archaeon]